LNRQPGSEWKLDGQGFIRSFTMLGLSVQLPKTTLPATPAKGEKYEHG